MNYLKPLTAKAARQFLSCWSASHISLLVSLSLFSQFMTESSILWIFAASEALAIPPENNPIAKMMQVTKF